MSDGQKQPAGDRPDGATRRRWRDDPLSVMLVVAALLLGMMYFLERRDLQTVEQGSERARELGARNLDLEGCIVEAAGLEARQLVVACRARTFEAIQAEIERRLEGEDIEGFDEIVVVGSDQTVACPLPVSRWPEQCQRKRGGVS